MDKWDRRLLRENRLHGNDSFPLEAYRIDREPGELVLDCHWHEEAEFFLVLEGEILFQVDADYTLVKAGEAVFIDGGDIHAGHAAAHAPCSYCAVVFDPRLLDSLGFDAVQTVSVGPLQERTCTFPRLIRPVSDWEKRLLGSLEAILEACFGRKPGYQTFIKGHLYLMLHEIAAEGRSVNRSRNSAAEPKGEKLKKTLQFMQQHYDRPIRIRELAEQIPMSEGQFSRFFKAMTRQTPVEYLNAYRIKQAAELLRSSDRKVSDIALEVGFEHISYFIRVFRKAMLVTPAQFRKGSGSNNVQKS